MPQQASLMRESKERDLNSVVGQFSINSEAHCIVVSRRNGMVLCAVTTMQCVDEFSISNLFISKFSIRSTYFDWQTKRWFMDWFKQIDKKFTFTWVVTCSKGRMMQEHLSRRKCKFHVIGSGILQLVNWYKMPVPWQTWNHLKVLLLNIQILIRALWCCVLIGWDESSINIYSILDVPFLVCIVLNNRCSGISRGFVFCAIH